MQVASSLERLLRYGLGEHGDQRKLGIPDDIWNKARSEDP